MKNVGFYLLFIALSCLACKKNDSNKTSAYNGFKVDGVVYQVDSIEHSYNDTRRPLKIHSNDNGGAAIYIHTMPDNFPSSDGVYQFKVMASRRDSLDVDVCFESDDRKSDYCAVEGVNGESLSSLTITIKSGKWNVSLAPITIFDNMAKTLEISANE